MVQGEKTYNRRRSYPEAGRDVTMMHPYLPAELPIKDVPLYASHAVVFHRDIFSEVGKVYLTPSLTLVTREVIAVEFIWAVYELRYDVHGACKGRHTRFDRVDTVTMVMDVRLRHVQSAVSINRDSVPLKRILQRK